MTAAGALTSMSGRSTLDVWVVEPFYGGSHKYFLDGLAEHSSHVIRQFTLPGRNWKWRMHGGALTLGQQARQLIAGGGRPPEVVFATDMLDIPVFLAVAGPEVCRSPFLVYFHENQLTYPLPAGVNRDLGYGMKNLVSALAARSVLFNSSYHRAEFLGAAQDLLDAMPDEVPSWVVPGLEAKSRVLPVGCDLRRLDEHRERGLADAAAGRWGDPAGGPLVLWNQRWEYDKAPEALFAALRSLKDEGVPFRLAVAGINHGAPLPEFLQAAADLSSHIVQWGPVPEWPDYASLLWAADVVVSTAVHEFFGVAVVEAIYCGCRPVLPDRLSYPEIVPSQVHGRVLYGEGELVAALRNAVAQPKAWSEDWQRTWVAGFDWATLGPRYDEEIRHCWKAAWEER